MIFWWVIAGLLVFAYCFFKFKDIRQKVGLIFMISVILFLVFSFWQVYSQGHVDLTSPSGWVNAGKMYVAWIMNLGHNVADVTGNVINKNWDVQNNVSSAAKSANNSSSIINVNGSDSGNSSAK